MTFSSQSDVNTLNDPDDPSFILSSQASWVSEPDRVLLNELVQLGYHYQALDVFVENEGMPITESSQFNRSIYRRALAAGISELKEVYQGAVLKIQYHLQSSSTPVLPSIRHFLIDFESLLPQIHRMLFRIVQENLRGRSLLILLFEMGQSGLPVLQSCIQRLLWHCNQVLYKQLSAWMVHGLLLDRTQEFFIRDNSQDRTESTSGIIEDAVQGDVWSTDFETVIGNIPPYIDEDTAERVNFIGQSIRLLRHPQGSFEGEDLLPYTDTLECARSLRELQNQCEFNSVAFDQTIESIRCKVASHLWHLVVVKAQLILHLEGLKDYFLLARGEFYHSFLVDSKSILELPPRDVTAEADINIPFFQAAYKSNAQYDKLFANVKLKWSKEEIQIKSRMGKNIKMPRFEDGWDDLYLSFHIDWPLGLIISPALLTRYNGLFQFLIKLKRIQLELEEAWQTMCSHRVRDDHRLERQSGRRQFFLTPSRKELTQIRHHMTHFITNLQVYLQHDVIEANFKKMTEEILQSKDFMKAARKHEEFLESLLLQSFLLTHTISDHINVVFKSCRAACVFIKYDDGSDQCEAADPRKVHALYRDFNNAIQNVYSLLQSSRLQERSKGPFLRQFFLRLNFNDFISRHLVVSGEETTQDRSTDNMITEGANQSRRQRR
eukprot:g38.t1